MWKSRPQPSFCYATQSDGLYATSVYTGLRIDPRLRYITSLTMTKKAKGALTLRVPFGALWLAVLLLLTASCGSTSPHAKLPNGTVDVPPLGRPAGVKGMASFMGWATGENGISAVDIYVDRVYIVSAQLGLVRPDVAATFPNETDSRTSGWQASVDSSKIAAGPHELVVQATAKNGAKRDIGAYQIVVVK